MRTADGTDLMFQDEWYRTEGYYFVFELILRINRSTDQILS